MLSCTMKLFRESNFREIFAVDGGERSEVPSILKPKKIAATTASRDWRFRDWATLDCCDGFQSRHPIEQLRSLIERPTKVGSSSRCRGFHCQVNLVCNAGAI